MEIKSANASMLKLKALNNLQLYKVVADRQQRMEVVVSTN